MRRAMSNSNAEGLLGFAKRIAEDSGATPHLLHVVPMLPALGEPEVSTTMHSPEEEKAINENHFRTEEN